MTKRAEVTSIPRARGFDQSLGFARDGYDFITRQCEQPGSDIFHGRLMLRPVVYMRGARAAELFYASGRFTRVGAMPVTILMLLQDFGSVQLLEGDAHRHRKAMFRAIGATDSAERWQIISSRSGTRRCRVGKRLNASCSSTRWKRC